MKEGKIIIIIRLEFERKLYKCKLLGNRKLCISHVASSKLIRKHFYSQLIIRSENVKKKKRKRVSTTDRNNLLFIYATNRAITELNRTNGRMMQCPYELFANFISFSVKWSLIWKRLISKNDRLLADLKSIALHSQRMSFSLNIVQSFV